MFCITGGVCITGGMTGGPEGTLVEYLILAGGGGGGGVQQSTAGTGGGGAGGALNQTRYLCKSQPYTIQVGAGGAGQSSQNNATGSNGVNSCLGTNVACGGGKGAYGNMPFWGPGVAACCGGSGGGGGMYQAGAAGIPGQGCCGGCGHPVGGGGGGGISTNGSSPAQYPFGGQGCFYPFNNVFSFGELCNSCRWIGGGGGGGNLFGQGGSGGLGGGGKGAKGATGTFPGNVPACPGSTNMGSGGGGGGGGYPGAALACYPGCSGGSGSVFLRYPSNLPDATTTGSPCFCCITNCYKYYWFQGSGTITFN